MRHTILGKSEKSVKDTLTNKKYRLPKMRVPCKRSYLQTMFLITTYHEEEFMLSLSVICEAKRKRAECGSKFDKQKQDPLPAPV
jgi:hypothetical protein